MKGTFVVPPSVLAKVKKIAGFQPQDDGLGEYPLDAAQARQVAKNPRLQAGARPLLLLRRAV
jgi:hypothetical protein